MATEKSPLGERIGITHHPIMTAQERGLAAFIENCRIISEKEGGLENWLPQLFETHQNHQSPTRIVIRKRP